MANDPRYRVWMEQAKHDLKAAQLSLDNKFYEWTCYQSTQAVEKIFKAVIVHGGYKPPRTHKLGVLIGMSNHANPDFLEVKINFRKVESFTFISRYPFIIPGNNKTPHEMIGLSDAQTVLTLANEIFSKVEEFVSGKKAKGGEKNMPIEDYYYTAEEVKTRLDELVEKISKCEDIKVEKIILFGGFARESTRPKSSTMDILVIGDTDKSFFDRIHYIRELTKGGFPIVEPIVYTADEFDKMLNDEGEGFLESALAEGKVLWEKK